MVSANWVTDIGQDGNLVYLAGNWWLMAQWASKKNKRNGCVIGIVFSEMVFRIWYWRIGSLS